MSLIHVSVGHDDNAVIAQLVNIELIAADARTQSGDERDDFLIG